MKNIRRGVFETNSSSIHSIAIPQEINKKVEMTDFRLDDFGWEFEEVNHLDYLYTAICDVYGKESKDKIERLKEILEDNEIKYHFEKPEYNEWGYINNGGIDHGSELILLLDELFNDEEKLIRYICGARVFTGNDNSIDDGRISRDEQFVREYDEHYNEIGLKENPYYIGEGYDWYFKCN